MEVATSAYVSENRVRNHVSNVFSKLAVDRRAAIIRAREAGLGSTPRFAGVGSPRYGDTHRL